MKKSLILILFVLGLTSCRVLMNKLIYHSYDYNLNIPVVHFNVYDKQDSLINTSIYKDKIVVLTFCRLGKFKYNYFDCKR